MEQVEEIREVSSGMKMIMARSENHVVGIENELPWYLPKDLARFKEITDGKTIIMGMNTFKSLPGILPNRQHIVLTHQDTVVRSPFVTMVKHPSEILARYQDDDDAFIIGGPTICRLFEEYCTDLYLTVVKSQIKGNKVWAEDGDWKEIKAEREKIEADAKNEYDMEFRHYIR